MYKWIWTALAAVPLAVFGGLVYANVQAKTEQPQQVKAESFTCPLTGEELPCPNCCPLNQRK